VSPASHAGLPAEGALYRKLHSQCNGGDAAKDAPSEEIPVASLTLLYVAERQACERRLPGSARPVPPSIRTVGYPFREKSIILLIGGTR
jgi:hypothetical protein